MARRWKRIDVHIRRYPIDALPVSEEGISQWLVDRFAEKNERINKFFTTGSFVLDSEKNANFVLPQLVREERVQPLRTFSKVVFLLSTLIPFFVMKNGAKLYGKIWLVGSLLGMLITSRY